MAGRDIPSRGGGDPKASSFHKSNGLLHYSYWGNGLLPHTDHSAQLHPRMLEINGGALNHAENMLEVPHHPLVQLGFFTRVTSYPSTDACMLG